MSKMDYTPEISVANESAASAIPLSDNSNEIDTLTCMESKMSEERKNIMEVVNSHRDDLEWLLEKQAELRAELMAFYKKDLKEIQAALTDSKENSFEKDAIANFIEQWKRSYDMISPAK